jgi:hypothetical protein
LIYLVSVSSKGYGSGEGGTAFPPTVREAGASGGRVPVREPRTRGGGGGGGVKPARERGYSITLVPHPYYPKAS